MEELISIIIPVYNVEKYLEMCVDSVINQTYKNIEILLVDDGSTDTSGKICDNIEQKDERIKVFHKNNGGLSSARNYGIHHSKGKYCIFIDSDDWIDSDMVECLYYSLKQNNVKIACCGKYVYEKEGNVVEIHWDKNEVLAFEKIVRIVAWDTQIGIAAWGKIFEKSLFNNIKFPNGEIHEDVAIMYRLLKMSENIAIVNKSKYYYRYTSDGISKSNYSHKFDVVLKHNIDNEIFINEVCPNLKGLMKAVTANSCIDMIIKIMKTKDGYENYVKEFNLYRSELKKRCFEYIKYKKNTIKEMLWFFIILIANKNICKLYKAIRIIK